MLLEVFCGEEDLFPIADQVFCMIIPVGCMIFTFSLHQPDHGTCLKKGIDHRELFGRATPDRSPFEEDSTLPPSPLCLAEEPEYKPTEFVGVQRVLA